MRLLVVEDEAPFQRVVKRALPDESIVPVRTLRRSLQILRGTDELDGALVDLNLTVKEDDYEGYEVLEAIQTYRRALPTIVMTGAPLEGLLRTKLIERFSLLDVLLKGDVERSSIVSDLREAVRRLKTAGVEARRSSAVDEVNRIGKEARRVVEQMEQRLRDTSTSQQFAHLPKKAKGPVDARLAAAQKRLAGMDLARDSAITACRECTDPEQLTAIVEEFRRQASDIG